MSMWTAVIALAVIYFYLLIGYIFGAYCWKVYTNAGGDFRRISFSRKLMLWPTCLHLEGGPEYIGRCYPQDKKDKYLLTVAFLWLGKVVINVPVYVAIAFSCALVGITSLFLDIFKAMIKCISDSLEWISNTHTVGRVISSEACGVKMSVKYIWRFFSWPFGWVRKNF